MKKAVPFKLRSCLLAMATSLLPGIAAAQTNWVANPSDAWWHNPANWSNGVPTSSADANINRSTGVILNTSGEQANRLYLGISGSGERTVLTVASSGSLSVIESGRLSLGNGTGSLNASLIIDGGSVSAVGRVYLGRYAGSDTMLTLKNGGTLSAGTIGLSNDANQKTVLHIGGETTAQAPGWADVTSVTGETAGANSVNTLNFNHTSTRYQFTRLSTGGDDVRIRGRVIVNLKAGTTVLAAGNDYTETTTVEAGARLLANYQTSSASFSSTGTGGVAVNQGGILGGIGYIGGDTVVDGWLKPGDYDAGAALPSLATLKFNRSLTLGAGSETEIFLNGTVRGETYGGLDVAGDLLLGGTLRIQLGGEFDLEAEESLTFRLFEVAGDFNGTFAAYELPEVWNGVALQWDVSGVSSEGELKVTAVPEPSTWVALGSGAALLFLARRRRLTA
ncbi:MAG TPA: PEP-CTERM sorting domain-containing protein [Chthoniobacteraceae bacterium]|nr:PEP-CTERM sorting domain-containing protein [Chthoniobacteraceae bacterium]